MIEQDRIIKMTKAALYEQKEKKHALYRMRFFKKDYVTLHMIVVWFCITIAYSMLGFIGLLCLVESTVNYSMIQWVFFAILAVVVYIGMVAVYMLIAWNVYTGRYEDAEESAKNYEGYLKELEE